MRALELESQWDILCNLGRAEGELGLDAEALRHLDECLKEYPPSRDKKVQQARGKFFDLRVEIRDRCEKMGCTYQEPQVSAGLGEQKTPPAATAEPKAAAAVAATKQEPVLSEKDHPSYINTPSAKWPVVITTGALGLVGVGFGIGFHVLAEDKKVEALGLQETLIDDGVACETSGYARCHEFYDAQGAFLDATTAEVASFIAGGTLATAAIVMAIVWPNAGSSSALGSLRPIVAVEPRNAFVGVSGQF